MSSKLQSVLQQVLNSPAYAVLNSTSPSFPFPSNPPTSDDDPPSDSDETLALLLPLLILMTTLLFLLLLFLVFLIVVRKNRGIVLRDDSGPTNLEMEDELEGDGGLQGIEQRWLEQADETIKIGYMRAKVWQSQYPPNSQPTDITLSQFLSIQEKGVSAWSFEPDYESNPALIVEARTEITFLADGVGMAPEEGGGCCVQSNLPLPRLNEVYYWECKMYEKPVGTQVAIGLTTKPFPSFRLPGWNKYSVGYFSSDGFKSHSYPFTASSYGPPLTEGDVLGVGYRPRTGTVFFTRNGKKLEDAYVGLNKHNLFPTVGANGACTVHVNLGQAGFVFIEANVKKWGLAPMVGSLLPPPAYGSERGSILLESARNGRMDRDRLTATITNVLPPTPPSPIDDSSPSASSSRRRPSVNTTTSNARRHKSKRHVNPPAPTPSASNSPALSSPGNMSASSAVTALASPSQPIRPSPLRHSRRASNLSDHSRSSSSSHSRSETISSSNDDGRNPPTPGPLDISLRSLHAFPNADLDEEDDDEVAVDAEGESDSAGEEDVQRAPLITRASPTPPSPSATPVVVEPPAYHPIDPHMYAPGVAEAVLEDAFSNVSSRQYAPQLPAGMILSSHTHSPGGFGSEVRYEASNPSTTSQVPASSGGGWWDWLGARGVPVENNILPVSNPAAGTVVDIFGVRRPAGTR